MRTLPVLSLVLAPIFGLACSGADSNAKKTGGSSVGSATGSGDDATSSSTTGTTGSSSGATGGAGGGDGGAGGGDGGAGGGDGGAGGGDGGADGGSPSVPQVCTGQEPCGLHPVVVPDGYTINPVPYVKVFNQDKFTSCAVFADCDMWNAHFTKEWQFGGAPVDRYYNRLGSPFPTFSRYWFVIPPKKVMYVKLHVAAPGELYRYSDGTPVRFTVRESGATTCFQRGPGHLLNGVLGNMGGTGNTGVIRWNISVLPGDMGDNVPLGTTGSLNVSKCQGTNGTFTLHFTSDPKVKYPNFCVLREGADYYLNFLSEPTIHNDCSTEECTMGFTVSVPTKTEDGSPFLVEVPCP